MRTDTPSPQPDVLGPARTGSYRADITQTSFKISVDLVAWSDEPGQSSGEVHRAVWDRVQAGDTDLRERLAGFGRIAVAGTAALEAGEHEAFADAIDANFDLRASIFGLTDDDRRLVEAVRAAGGAAKFCGSGGSIVAMARAGHDLDVIGDALDATGASVRRGVRIALAP